MVSTVTSSTSSGRNPHKKRVFQITYSTPTGAGSANVKAYTKHAAKNAVLRKVPDAYNLRAYDAGQIR